jgi:hypothetical protein
VDVVLGVSMGSTAVRMVLVEGENADGVTVDEDNFRITAPDPQDPATSGAPGQVLSAILGTRECAAEGGYQLTSTGVAWTDPTEAAVLRDALAAYKIQNVMLVSAFLAAAALTQAVGHAIGYSRTAMLLIDPEYATVGIVDSDDGSITGVRREPLHPSRRGADTIAQLAAMITSVNARQARAEGVFLVGRGIDIAALKPALEAVTPMRVNAPEEPEMALARGAALASASSPLFVSSTGALAYAQDPGTGEVGPYRPAEYSSVAGVPDGSGFDPIGYSGVPDDDADADTVVMDPVTGSGPDETRQRRRPVLLISSVLAVIFISAVVALEVALAINIRATVALQPSPEQNLIVPTQQAPAPAPAPQAPAPNHQLVPLSQPVPNIVARPPAAAPPALPAPVAPPAPVPIPVAPAPVPLPVPAPAAPLPVPNIQPLVKVPAPPVHLPNPPLRVPTAPLQPPAPKPPVQLPTPKPPVGLPKPEPPVQLPVPKAPTAPIIPAPVAPRIPVMPAPVAPRIPVLPAPVAPRIPVMPRIPVTIPHFGR